ncbi:MAG: glycosyltransferase family 2 protein [Deltaproteobacteria bacterium]|nr:glycosyltransferase family 2 protein [Deltaproteobacteria bacterium]
MSGLCVLIPSYNAEGTLKGVLEGVKRSHLDIIVVDDGSTDSTARIAWETGVTLIRHSENRGKGRALRTGFTYVMEHGYEAVITLDADGQHDAAEIPQFVELYRKENADIIIGSRAAQFNEMDWPRRFWNRLGARAVSRLTGTLVSDSQSGYRLIRTEVLRDVELITATYETEMELLIRACKKGYRVVNMSIIGHAISDTTTSHFRPVVDTFKICMLYLRSLLWK